ncbi:RluA family pseudouridine synthase [Candidatus Schneideria nysicola]|uniref:RluA family pseudouridine synthase n=1 Tax=Candidatus Schneideria nysicola TaxID=1081631 RepID=UPI001CAA4A80|nr:RluA family pseudouridine synthase [Candidatus Schneideria nysicola]UAJ65389.1 RluA family pseudouridine synthase [Candidatus Schneideria nysicola]
MKNTKNNDYFYFAIPIDRIDQRIDNFLHIYLSTVPKSAIYRLLRKGIIKVNGYSIKPNYKFKNNDRIYIPQKIYSQHINDKRIFNSTYLNTEKIQFLNKRILYEDSYLLIIDKPTGIAVHGGSGLSYGIIEGLRILRNDVSLELVHRLDKDTSGILIIAKKRSALRFLHEQFRINNILKYYLALVKGTWNIKEKSITTYLHKKISGISRLMTNDNRIGKKSETCFQIKEKFRIATLVNISPITGRTHQIRVHSQYLGHPIALDKLYGDNDFNNLMKKKCGLNRLFLHASELICIHPNTKKTLYIKAPIDNHLNKCLLYLRKNIQ